MKEADILVLGLLLVNGVIDIWKKRISLCSIGIYLLIWVCAFASDCEWIRIGAALVPGIIMLIISILSRGAIGMGDGILVMALGVCLSWMEIAIVLAIALMLSFFWAVIQLLARKNRMYAFPFVPFLFMGYLVSLCL